MRIVDGFRLRDVMGHATVIGEGTGQVDFNKLITLNDAAAFLWRSVEGSDFDEEVLAGLLIDRYDIDSEVAAKDAAAIAAQWVEIGLVEK